MRASVLVIALAACGAHIGPAVIPKLSEVPADKQDEIIASSLERPGPENQPKTERGRKIETAAATAAAFVGMFFSKTQNATLGWQFLPEPPRKVTANGTIDNGEPAPNPAPAADPKDFVPWVHLAPPAPAPPSDDR